MCKTSLHGFLAALPKCEHHMHLEGSLSPELLFSLAAKNSISLPTTAEDPAFASIESLYARYDAFTSLDDFLAYYYIAFRVLLTQSDFEDLAYTYFERAHAANVRHAEVFFDPQAHTSRGVAYDTVVAGFVAAQARAQTDFGISSLLIPCLLRHLPVSDSVAAFNEAKDAGHFTDGTLAGIGLCGSEVGFPPRLWKGIYDEAAALGIRRTVHAGEEGPAAFVGAALDELGAMRVDHGINSAQDEALLERLARDGVMLTVCPLSNVRLRCVPAMSDLPIRRLLDKGVKFSVNSDDPAYFGGYIQENYCAVQEAFGLNVDEWVCIARNTVEGSWCGERRKSEILSEIENIVGEWRERLAA